MMFEQAYVDGFAEKCAELGLDPANFGFDKKSELQLLTEALPLMDSTDIAIVEGFAKECAANNQDPEALIKVAIGETGLASGIKGLWNKHVGSRGSGAGRWAAGVGSGLKGAFKGLNEGGVGNMRSGYQQGAAPAQQQYDAANAQQRQRGEAQLGVAGAQWNRNVAAPVRAAGQKAISPISVPAAYYGGGAQAGANVYDAPQRTMAQANQRLTQAQTTLAGLPGAPQPAQQAQQQGNPAQPARQNVRLIGDTQMTGFRPTSSGTAYGVPVQRGTVPGSTQPNQPESWEQAEPWEAATENRLRSRASQLPGQTTTSPLPGGGTRTTTQRSGTFVAGQPYDPQNPTAQQQAVQQIRGQAAGQPAQQQGNPQLGTWTGDIYGQKVTRHDVERPSRMMGNTQWAANAPQRRTSDSDF